MIFMFWSYLSHFKSDFDCVKSKFGLFNLHNYQLDFDDVKSKVSLWFTKYNLTSNQTQFTKPYVPNQIHKAKGYG